MGGNESGEYGFYLIFLHFEFILSSIYMLNKLYLYLPTLFCLILSAIFYQPQLKKTIIGYSLIFLFTIISVLFLIKWKIKTRWMFLLQSAVLILSALVFFLFLDNLVWQIIFTLIFIIALGFFLFHLFQLFYQPRICQPEALGEMTPWLNGAIIYWFLVGLSAGLDKTPLESDFFLYLPLVFILFFWLGYYFYFLKGIDFKSIKTDLLIISLALTEIYLAINFLPFGFYFNALTISVLYLIIINLWQKTKSFV